MGVSEKYTYIRTILILPFGIACLIGGFNLFKYIPRDVEKFYRIDGFIDEYGFTTRRIQINEYDDELPVFVLRINKIDYYNELGRVQKILKPLADSAFRNRLPVTLWTNIGEEKNRIEQLAINHNLVFKYKPPIWQAWTFFIIGLVFSIMGSIYLIKYYDSTWKKKK